jgi:hypothetical protein
MERPGSPAASSPERGSAFPWHAVLASVVAVAALPAALWLSRHPWGTLFWAPYALLAVGFTATLVALGSRSKVSRFAGIAVVVYAASFLRLVLG